MEDIRRMACTAVAPIAWGSTYVVTSRYLPAGVPLWGGAIRALPAGLLLLALVRVRPHGAWWWRSAVLGTLNMGVFFGLVYLAAQRLPTSTASMVMANSPVVLMLVAWLVVAQRPRVLALAGAAIGIAGAVLVLGGGAGGVDAVGLVASVAAMAISAVGYCLATRWSAAPDAPGVVATTAWQLVAGGVLLVPAAVVVHGPPPALDAAATIGFAYVIVIATAVAFVAWFAGLRTLPAATVGLVGLLNPVTGVVLGTAVAGEGIGRGQAIGIVLVFAGILVGRRAGRPSVAATRSGEGAMAPRPGMVATFRDAVRSRSTNSPGGTNREDQGRDPLGGQHPVERRGDRARRAQGRRGGREDRRLRHVPLRRAPAHR